MATHARPTGSEQSYIPALAASSLSGIRQLRGIEAAVRLATDSARIAKERRPSLEEAFKEEMKVEIAELERKLFFVEHDSAGAFKPEKLGRRIQELFKKDAEGRAELVFEENGELKLAESESEKEGRRRILLVNMAELARFNKEGGGHAAGDAALKATAEAIEENVTKILEGKKTPEADYQVYRLDGNTFAVELTSISLQDFGKLVKEMGEAEPRIEGVNDPAPLVVRGLDFRDVVGLVNNLQEKLEREGAAHAKIATEEEAAREIFTMLQRLGGLDLEISKFAKLASRVKEKIDAAASAPSGERDGLEKEARDFFENYAKKAFQNTQFSSFESFREALADQEFQNEIDALAIQHAEKRFTEQEDAEERLVKLVDARVKERGIPPKDQVVEKQPAAFEGLPMDGLKELEKMRAAAESAEKDAQAHPDDELAPLRVKKARIEYQIEIARRDQGTGLLRRGVYYEHLQKALEGGKDVAVVFIDMGFLKYFDQMGGTEVGDDALRTAAGLIEQAIKGAGVKGEGYRYGGDEFTVQLEGGKDAADKFIGALERLRTQSAPIPKTEKSRVEYAPTRLSFNYGQADRKMLEELLGVVGSETRLPTDEPLKDDQLNTQAELMTKAADIGIEYNKAFSRFMLLIEQMRDPKYATDSAREKQVDALIGFSNKAIYAELGGADFLRKTAGTELTGEALNSKVREYVLEVVSRARGEEWERLKKEDQLMIRQAEVSFLQAQLTELSKKVHAQDVQILNLQERVRKAEKERDALAGVRDDLRRAA